MDKVKVGIIGCGNISSTYLKNGTTMFEEFEVVACADLDVSRAQEKAEKFGIAKAYTVEQLLADPEIELVINLTIPAAHASVCIAALEAGKHVYVEKPLAVTREEGLRILEVAESKGLRVGSAPDTFLGAGIQTSIKAVEDGLIGKPVAAQGFMMSKGHEGWHPDPDFYYKAGGGPMFDMGPYYITALIALLGPIRRVAGSTSKALEERISAKKGTVITVDVPTHVTGVMDFHRGVSATLTTSFDILAGTELPHIEIYGTEGTLRVPNPNNFKLPAFIRRKDETAWEELPFTHGFPESARGLGVADMAKAIRTGRQHRANGELAFHVLETMHAFHDSSDEGKHYVMKSTCERPRPLPADMSGRIID